ncbi:gamma-glutamylcyclotransferase [Metamycoplasma phocicerebrale]|uniref:Gamma-glutamylcyclotransferase n=1 Tax=Metamycoplasma phocicerebrale TaxID=142649 RepID=A0A3Q9V5J3_9BACT|nr:gamma-glutamylcyclotransferase family protein [Metamycoplasma phocicerebrale]AZZ65597.1 gamma-glutamylcyclotransferase [Metamycoplasma phocicerebrale]
MKQEKIYLFAYDELEHLDFFGKLFGLGVINKSARLNGFIKCINPSSEVFIKKDKNSFVKGTLFEITKEQLFLVDKWKLLPKYDRFPVNILLEDNNSIVEDAFVYSKIEFGEFEPFENKKELFNINNYRESFNYFLDSQKQKLQNFDFVFLYKPSKKDWEYLSQIKTTNIFIKLTIDNDKNIYNTTYISTAFCPFVDKGQPYIALAAFNRSDSFNVISYYEIFNNININDYGKNIKIEFIDVNKIMDTAFFDKEKPVFFLSNREDKTTEQNKYAFKENVFEYVLKDFDINHWSRFNNLLGLFFEVNKK